MHASAIGNMRYEINSTYHETHVRNSFGWQSSMRSVNSAWCNPRNGMKQDDVVMKWDGLVVLQTKY